jgi:hypothetical protein
MGRSASSAGGDMAGKKGRSGRRPGSRSLSNPVALAGHHLAVLIEMWLARAPIKVAPNRRPKRRRTIPPKIKRGLAKKAIAHVVELASLRVGHRRGAKDFYEPDIDDVLQYARRRAPAVTLRDDKKRQSHADPREAAFRLLELRARHGWRLGRGIIRP